MILREYRLIPPEEVDVVLRVKHQELLLGGRHRPIQFHLRLQPVLQNQFIRQGKTMWFHWMTLPIMVVSNSFIEKVRNTVLGARTILVQGKAHPCPLAHFDLEKHMDYFGAILQV